MQEGSQQEGTAEISNRRLLQHAHKSAMNACFCTTHMHAHHLLSTAVLVSLRLWFGHAYLLLEGP
jgi:hypothetical protein